MTAQSPPVSWQAASSDGAASSFLGAAFRFAGVFAAAFFCSRFFFFHGSLAAAATRDGLSNASNGRRKGGGC